MASRQALQRAFRYFWLVLGFACLYVLLDFSLDTRSPQIHSSYRFTLPELPLDQPQILRQDNLSIVVIRRSAAAIELLQQRADGLQDALSGSSHQPDYARNRLRSRHAEYFVSYALGTDLGCGLIATGAELREICGDARYDFAGRALRGNKRFQNLAIPDYTFADDYGSLTVKP